MHAVQREHAVFFDIKRRVRRAARVVLPRRAVESLIKHISFGPWFLFMVLRVDADIQKLFNLPVCYGQR